MATKKNAAWARASTSADSSTTRPTVPPWAACSSDGSPRSGGQSGRCPRGTGSSVSGKTCALAVRDVLHRIGDKWSLLTLEELANGPERFSELHRTIGDVTRQMLSKTLKHLEADGLVSRTVYAEVPPRVEYALTPLGTSFLEPMKILIAWADTHHEAICRARAGLAA